MNQSLGILAMLGSLAGDTGPRERHNAPWYENLKLRMMGKARTTVARRKKRKAQQAGRRASRK